MGLGVAGSPQEREGGGGRVHLGQGGSYCAGRRSRWKQRENDGLKEYVLFFCLNVWAFFKGNMVYVFFFF